MKKIFNFLIVAILFLGCQKNNVSNDLSTNNQKEKINTLIAKAKTTLKAAMPSEDFASLDWKNIQIKNLKIKNPILKLSSTAEKNKFLYYSNIKNEEIYNWVTYNLNTTNKQVSGLISVNDVSNKLLREISLVNNKIVSLYDVINSPTASTVVTMDEVIVTGYLNQQGFNYLSY